LSPFQTKATWESTISGRSRYRKIFGFIAVGAVVLCFTAVALAGHPNLVWMDALIQRIEPRSRMLSIWDYRNGRTT
jgi:hypothetical protein